MGSTTKTNDEIEAFNLEYLNDHSEYSFVGNNCQHYVYSLVKMLVGDTTKLPMLETRKAAAVGGVLGGLAILGAAAGLAYWRTPKEDPEDTEKEKSKERVVKPKTNDKS